MSIIQQTEDLGAKGLREAIKKAQGMPYDADILRQVEERAQQIREDIHKRLGVVNMAVPLIREMRDE